MPFTFSHPAAVLPAKLLPARWVSFTALIVGSITPDFEYFIHMRCLSKYSHTLAGMFWFDLPLAFVLTFIYHLWVRDTLIDNLPGFLRKRLNRFKGFDWLTYVKQNKLVVLLCLLAGIFSHVVWDSFTHRTGYFVRHIPWLQLNTEVLGVQHVRFYILQNISSALGLLAVVLAIMIIPKETDVLRWKILKYWATVAFITVVITVLRSLFYKASANTNLFVINQHAGLPSVVIPEDLIMTVISACLIGVLITSLLFKKKPMPQL